LECGSALPLFLAHVQSKLMNEIGAVSSTTLEGES
jgi:hypothetical protein